MLSKSVVVIMAFPRREGQARYDLALQLHIFSHLTRLGVGRGIRRCIFPALFLLHAEDGLIAWDDGPRCLDTPRGCCCPDSYQFEQWGPTALL